MLQVFRSGRATILDQLKELLEARWQHAIPETVVGVHDIFSVPYTHVGELKRVMAYASKRLMGTAMAVEASGQGLDEVADAVRLDFQSWRQTPRCEGYLFRLKRWEERKGKEVVPYVV